MSPRSGLELQSHRFRLRTYLNCLVGSELVDWLLIYEKTSTRYKVTIMFKLNSFKFWTLRLINLCRAQARGILHCTNNVVTGVGSMGFPYTPTLTNELWLKGVGVLLGIFGGGLPPSFPNHDPMLVCSLGSA